MKKAEHEMCRFCVGQNDEPVANWLSFDTGIFQACRIEDGWLVLHADKQALETMAVLVRSAQQELERFVRRAS